MTTWDLEFNQPNVPVSVNASGGRHWALVRRQVEPWKSIAWALANNRRVRAQDFTPAPITVHVTLEFRTVRRRDPHNYTGTVVKAIVDALVRARVVPDDTPDWVTVLDPTLRAVPHPKPLRATVSIRPREGTHP